MEGVYNEVCRTTDEDVDEVEVAEELEVVVAVVVEEDVVDEAVLEEDEVFEVGEVDVCCWEVEDGEVVGDVGEGAAELMTAEDFCPPPCVVEVEVDKIDSPGKVGLNRAARARGR